MQVLAKNTKKLGDEQVKTKKKTKDLKRETDKLNDAHARNDRLNKSVYQSNLSAAKGFSKQKEMIGGGSSGLVAAYATLAANIFAATAAFNALKNASEVNTLIEGFSAIARQTGRSAMVLAEGLREAAGGALSLEAALRASAIGTTTGMSADEMERLTTVARNASIALGRDLADATDRLFRGVAKLEPEILDELGILVRLDDAAEAYGASIGKAGGDLSRAERQQAFLNATLEQGERKYGRLTESVDENPFTVLAASFQDLTREILNFLNTALVPLARTLAENTTLLLGTLVLFGSTIVKTMFPVLTELGKRQAFTASQTAAAARVTEEAANAEVVAAKKRVQASKVGGATVKQFQMQSKITGATLEYDKVLKALKISETQRANNLNKYTGKELQNKKKELEAVRQLKNEVLALRQAEAGTAGAGRDVRRLDAQASAQRSMGAGLDRIGQNTGLGGFKQARKELDLFSKKMLVAEKRQGNFVGKKGQRKFTSFGKQAMFGFRMAGAGAKFFGAALVNAIPLIGQIIFVVGLAIEGIKSLVGAFQSQAAENNKIRDAYGEVEKALKEVKEANGKLAADMMTTADAAKLASLEAQQMGNELAFTSGAVDQFRTSVKGLTEELNEESLTRMDKWADSFGDFVGSIISSIGDLASSAWEGTINIITGIGNAIKDGANSFVGLFSENKEFFGELTPKEADAEKFETFYEKIEDNDPTKLLREQLSGPLAGKFAKMYDETFGEKGVVGTMKEYEEQGISFEEASKRINSSLSDLSKPFTDTQITLDNFSDAFQESNKQLVAFQDRAKKKNEFRVLRDNLKSTFNVAGIVAGGLLNQAEAQEQVLNKITESGGIGALAKFGITAENLFEQVSDGAEGTTTRIEKLISDLGELAVMQEQLANKKKLSSTLQQAAKAALAATLATNKLNLQVASLQKTGKFELTSDQEVANASAVAKLRADSAIAEFNAKVDLIDLETKFLLAKAELNKAILGDEYDNTVKLINAVDTAAKEAAGSTLDATLTGVNSELLKTLTGAGQSGTLLERIGSANQLFQNDTISGFGVDAEGNQVEKEFEITTKNRIEALKGVLTPMQEELAKFGPEGEYVNSAISGIFMIAGAFDTLSSGTLKSAEGLEAVGQIIAGVAQMMAANSRMQIKEVENQIAAEKKRDGKSKESLEKIKQLEKQKEKIERKNFERNKKMQMAQIVVNTAAAVVKTLGDTGFFGSPLAMAVAAMGAAQLAIAAKQQYQGGSSGGVEAPKMTNLKVGKVGNAVDVSQRTTAGELEYLRGGRTTGMNLGGAGGNLPGAAMGRKGYADGGVVVGERGPEVITPTTSVDVTPNYELGGGTSNVNFTINAVDAAGVEDVLMNQRGNIIRMIREAANDHGEMFLEDIDTQSYGSST